MHHATDFADLPEADAAFARLARRQLRASETLDWTSSVRLSAARARAVAAADKPAGSQPWLRWAAPAATAFLVMAYVSWQHDAALVETQEVSAAVNPVAPDALEWATDEAGPGFYRDLAFYQWLEHHSPSEPNA
jgi:hypothetical protein